MKIWESHLDSFVKVYKLNTIVSIVWHTFGIRAQHRCNLRRATKEIRRKDQVLMSMQMWCNRFAYEVSSFSLLAASSKGMSSSAS